MDLISVLSSAVLWAANLVHIGPQGIAAAAGFALSALAISEVLPFVKKIEANGIVQGFINVLKKLAGK